mgnify:FL=1
MSNLEIKEIRKKLKLSQTDLAKMLGVSLRTIQNWEAGETIPKTKHEILRNILSNKNEPLTEKENDIIEINELNNIDLLEKENILLKHDALVYKELADARLDVIEGLRFKIATLEEKISELRYTKSETFLHANVAGPAPELIGKKRK